MGFKIKIIKVWPKCSINVLSQFSIKDDLIEAEIKIIKSSTFEMETKFGWLTVMKSEVSDNLQARIL